MEHKGEWMATVGHSLPGRWLVCFSVRTRKRTTVQPGSAEGCVGPRGDLDGASLQIKSDPQAPWKQRCNKLSSRVAYKLLKTFPAWCNSPLRGALNFICSPNFVLGAPHQKEAKNNLPNWSCWAWAGRRFGNPFSSLPTPLFGVKGVFLLRSREPVLPILTGKPGWVLVSNHLPAENGWIVGYSHRCRRWGSLGLEISHFSFPLPGKVNLCPSVFQASTTMNSCSKYCWWGYSLIHAKKILRSSSPRGACLDLCGWPDAKLELDPRHFLFFSSSHRKPKQKTYPHSFVPTPQYHRAPWHQAKVPSPFGPWLGPFLTNTAPRDPLSNFILSPAVILLANFWISPNFWFRSQYHFLCNVGVLRWHHEHKAHASCPTFILSLIKWLGRVSPMPGAAQPWCIVVDELPSCMPLPWIWMVGID